MTPPLVSERFPYLPLRLDLGGRAFSLEALIDTGFDGDLVVPSDVLTSDPDDFQRWSLADGSVVYAPMYFGRARLDGFDSFGVLVTVLGDEPLVGRGVTDRFRLVLDHGERVIIEP
jgi:predicted aspartyl protease